MELQVEHLSDGVARAVAIGRWDVAGAAAIDLRLSALAGSGRSVIVDMAQVTFLSSMGIRSILMSAKTVQLRKAVLVLLAPVDMVEQVLISTGIDTIVPIHPDFPAALAAVGG